MIHGWINCGKILNVLNFWNFILNLSHLLKRFLPSGVEKYLLAVASSPIVKLERWFISIKTAWAPKERKNTTEKKRLRDTKRLLNVSNPEIGHFSKRRVIIYRNRKWEGAKDEPAVGGWYEFLEKLPKIGPKSVSDQIFGLNWQKCHFYLIKFTFFRLKLYIS